MRLTVRRRSTAYGTRSDRKLPRAFSAVWTTFTSSRSKILYLGGASGTTVSHCSDLVGPEGTVYAVEFSHRSGRDLVNMAKKRINAIPIIEDARHPQKYRMLVGMVDTIFADVAQPDQARIVGLNAQYFLKQGGNFMISIKASRHRSHRSGGRLRRSQEAANGRLQAGRTAHVRTVRTRSRNGCWCFSGGKKEGIKNSS